jgi:predicted lipoprotein with Yx(FWY)xxD motif
MARRILRLFALLSVIGFAFAQDEEPNVTTATSDHYGEYLVDGDGQTLYLFVKEGANVDRQPYTEGIRPAAAACAEACLDAWPPLDAPAGVDAGSGVDAELLYTERINGVNQVVYNGWPLYYFMRDDQPGQINGQDVHSFGGEWYIVSPQGYARKANDAGQANGGASNASTEEALQELHLLVVEDGRFSNAEFVSALDTWRASLLGDLEEGDVVLAAAVDPVVEAYSADPFQPEPLAMALEQLALNMRIVAREGDNALLVETASAVSQLSGLVKDGGFTPTMEVDIP